MKSFRKRNTISLLLLCFLMVIMTGHALANSSIDNGITTSMIQTICNQYGYVDRTTYWVYNESRDKAAHPNLPDDWYVGSTDSSYNTNNQIGSGLTLSYRVGSLYECAGFASFIGYKLTGSVPKTSSINSTSGLGNGWVAYSSSEIINSGGVRPGDIIRTQSHSAVVYSVNADGSFTVAERWGGSHNKISIGHGFNANGNASYLNSISGVLYVLRYGNAVVISLPEEPEITGATYPENLSNGSTFGLRGTISCKYTMTKIEAVLTNRATHQVISFDPAPEAPISANTYTLGNESVNNNLRFNDPRLYDSHLNYSLVVTYEKDGVIYTKKVIDHDFTIGNPGELIWVSISPTLNFGLGYVADIYTELNIDGNFTDLNWSSSNTDVLRAINGRLYGVGCGEAVLTATTTNDPTVSAQCIVSVYIASFQEIGELEDEETTAYLSLENGSCGELFVFKSRNITASFTFSSSGNSDTYATLYDVDFNVLKQDDDSGTGSNFSLSDVIMKDTDYYLFVRGYDPTNSIQCNISFKRMITDMTEGVVYTAYVEKRGQRNYFRFTPSENGIYSFTSSGGTQTAPPYAVLTNSPTLSGHTLAYGNPDGSEENFLLEYELSAGEIYYLWTMYYRSNETGSYTVSVNKSAPAYIASGTCGDNLTWIFTADGTLTISGTGEMNNYDNTVPPWWDYNNDITAVVISQGVTSVGNKASMATLI